MIEKSTFQFLKDLERNNNREWFNDHKKTYQQAQQNFIFFINELISSLTQIEPDWQGLTAKDCIFRIYRDIRFSKNKQPYKDHFGAHIAKGGRKSSGPGYYIQIKPSGSLLAGGIFNPDSQQLKAIRQEIDYSSKEFLKIVESKRFKAYFGKLKGDQLKTKPKGYEKDHQMIKYLRYKSFLMMYELEDEEIFERNLIFKLLRISEEMQPFNRFILKALS